MEVLVNQVIVAGIAPYVPFHLLAIQPTHARAPLSVAEGDDVFFDDTDADVPVVDSEGAFYDEDAEDDVDFDDEDDDSDDYPFEGEDDDFAEDDD